MFPNNVVDFGMLLKELKNLKREKIFILIIFIQKTTKD
jgi:hypothetical protein